MLTDIDISEIWEAINRLVARIEALEQRAQPSAKPNNDTHDSGRVKYGAGMMRY